MRIAVVIDYRISDEHVFISDVSYVDMKMDVVRKVFIGYSRNEVVNENFCTTNLHMELWKVINN